MLTNRPRTRQRTYKKPPALDVPNIDEDAAERKRVLNVLAQRRYRGSSLSCNQASLRPDRHIGEKKRLDRLKTKAAGSNESQNSEPQDETAPNSEGRVSKDDIYAIPTLKSNLESNLSIPPTTDADILAGFDLNLTSWNPLGDPLQDLTFAPILPDPNIVPDYLPEDHTGGDSVINTHHDLSTDFAGADMTMFIDSSPLSSSPSPSEGQTFPDSYQLPLLQHTLLKAVMRIADRLNLKPDLWDLGGNSAFNTGTATPASLLPPSWKPTPSQVAIPHHPVFDLLPWPGVRERAIFILSLPDELRPPRAQGALAIVNFAYDVEDTAEGVRIYGDDPYDPGNWELGQVMFERWWFLFDNNIISTSNRWRRARGAPPLLLKSRSPGSSPTASTSSATTGGS
ncbi:DUF3425 domain protein [Fusarium subglutinans]|uniref:DUF3425 domain protein n=1 Tax=Gibberella subglutinans TaxID=42677 RepID=A0A8H5Q6D9_GIBSU|nr:DUF3425 domain protein [Fusarium subglutinans]KAF5610001.1 DUF3425 domain protein [Fusarium subglutinans]